MTTKLTGQGINQRNSQEELDNSKGGAEISSSDVHQQDSSCLQPFS